MATAPQRWPDLISAVSDQYKNATIEIRNPRLVTSVRNVETNQVEITGDPVVATDIPARIQPIGAPSNVAGTQVSNPSGEVRIRIQIPRTAHSGKINAGWQIRVLSAERNPELTEYLFVVDENVNSSWRASNTITATVNVENDPSWTD